MPKRPTSKICNKCRLRYQGRRCSCSPDTRESSFDRGYDAQWRKVRISILASAGIPEDQWPLYAVDHNPPYDKNIEPDHTRYTLIPKLIADHNRKTAIEDTPRDADGNFASKDVQPIVIPDMVEVLTPPPVVVDPLAVEYVEIIEPVAVVVESDGAKDLPAETTDSQ